ncbi:hypothetical protein [Neisseria meningitidis]|uniref:hypothetical protein n=1 Tax=Neisseria meningitidis TaxID=487 RepID=UPI001C6522E9|nr:hypothetical protein [Neisseria meningitidis]
MPSEAFRRHFQHRNFKEKEPKPSFPRKTENQKRVPTDLDSRLHGNDDILGFCFDFLFLRE